MGYRIVRRSTKARGFSYEKYYAVGHNRKIYLGADTQGAQEKIEAWLSKHVSE